MLSSSRVPEEMPLVKVAQLSQLPAGSVTEVSVDGAFYAICNVAGRVTALSGTCPHRGGPLGQGAIHGNYVVCPWHAWEWDCATGANDFDTTRQVPTFEVRVAGDDILIELA
jgi:nitrite reductase/ring-hydroxylating ferredoxin subunit